MRRLPALALLLLPTAAIAATIVPPATAAPADPAIRLSDTNLVWGDVQVGTSDVRTVTVSNPGGAALTLGPSSLGGGDPQDFAIAGNTCAGKALATGQSCQITVRFSPTTPSTRVAHMSVPSTDYQGCAAYVTLAGTGSTSGSAPDAERDKGFDTPCTGAKTSAPVTTTTTTPGPSTGVLGVSQGGGSTVCKSVRRLRIHIKPPRGAAFKAGSLTVATKGRSFEVRKAKTARRKGQYYSDLSFAGLKVGRYEVKIRGRLASGARYARERHFVTCVSGRTP